MLDKLKIVFIKQLILTTQLRPQSFHRIKDAKPDLIGIALYDNIQFSIGDLKGLNETKWKKNEIEIIFSEVVMLSWAIGIVSNDLFGTSEAIKEKKMENALDDVCPVSQRDENDSYWSDVKQVLKLKNTESILQIHGLSW